MGISHCHMCSANPTDSRSNQPGSLDNGVDCPVCHRPTCRQHLGTVRWRWIKTGVLDSARVCLDCKNAYRHREWDAVQRDWIS
jgi:C4-type Zn-finger protein